MTPTFSILIPTFNRAAYLKRCLRGVTADPSQDVEVLVRDNASTDDTPMVVREFAADPRVRCARNEVNVGPERNILRLASEASGDYVLWLTDDDQLNPGALDYLRHLVVTQH